MKNEEHKTAIYQESASKIEVKIKNNTVWLTQAQIETLFRSSKANISEHIKHVYTSEELDRGATVRNFRTVRQEGSRTVTRNLTYYNLDLILAVGYRIDSKQSHQFRLWTNSVLQNKNEIARLGQNTGTLQVIHSKIFQIRGCTVMLDADLANFYQTETRILKQAVRRNLDRFPADFMFKLTNQEVHILGSQSVIPLHRNTGKSQPFAFTEQGVAMLSAVLNTPIAVDMSLQIMRAFVEIRKLALSQYSTENRLAHVEQKQIESDKKIHQLFEAIDQKKLIPDQGIFFDGQIFEAYTFVSDIICKAEREIILIDNFIDHSVLTLLSKKQAHVRCLIYTKHINQRVQLDAQRFNSQYCLPNGSGGATLYQFSKSHDRFLILDHKEVYHIGASLKDLGKKWFAFTRIDSFVDKILGEL